MTRTGTRAGITARAVALAAIGAVGCAHRPVPQTAEPIRVEGRRPDRRALEGIWSGEFRNDRTGRGGTIRFSFAPGQDTAYARVTVHGPAPVPACDDPLSQAVSPDGNGELILRLAWLSVEAGSIGGWLAPYHDPEAGCVMDTWFEGTAWKDRIEGSYFARPTDGDTIHIGRWEVRRER